MTEKTKSEALEKFLRKWKRGYIKHIITSAKEVADFEKENELDEDCYTIMSHRYSRQAVRWFWAKYHKVRWYSIRKEIRNLANKEVDKKRSNFIEKVEKTVGEITDAKNLILGYDGSINGLVEGTKGKAKVETIFAGGYNIQCLHYRILVKKI